VIDGIKKRIAYYGYTYARQRASAWTDPFIEAEQSSTDKILDTQEKKETKVVQMYPNQDIKTKAA